MLLLLRTNASGVHMFSVNYISYYFVDKNLIILRHYSKYEIQVQHCISYGGYLMLQINN